MTLKAGDRVIIKEPDFLNRLGTVAGYQREMHWYRVTLDRVQDERGPLRVVTVGAIWLERIAEQEVGR